MQHFYARNYKEDNNSATLFILTFLTELGINIVIFLGRVLANEWVKLRYGVYDEVGYVKDAFYPAYYKTVSRDSGEETLQPSRCSNSRVAGKK